MTTDEHPDDLRLKGLYPFGATDVPQPPAKFLLILWEFNNFGDREFCGMHYFHVSDMDAAGIAAIDYMKRKYGNEPDFLGDIGNKIGEAEILEIINRREIDIDGIKARAEEKRETIKAREKETIERAQYNWLKEKYG